MTCAFGKMRCADAELIFGRVDEGRCGRITRFIWIVCSRYNSHTLPTGLRDSDDPLMIHLFLRVSRMRAFLFEVADASFGEGIIVITL